MRRPCGRGRTGLALTWHGDLVSVDDMRGKVHGDEIGIVRRPARFSQRVLRTRITGKRIHARMHDRTRNIYECLWSRRWRTTHEFARRAQFGRGMRSELCRP